MHSCMDVLVPGVHFKDTLLIRNLFFYLQALPQWVRMINDTQMDSGEKLQWECKAIGRPRPTYRWLRNGLPLTSQVPILLHSTLSFALWNIWIILVNLHIDYMQYNPANYLRIQEGHSFILFSFFFLFQGRLEIANGELTIHKVQQADSGMYQCVAENKYAAIYSNAELQILGIS